MPAGALIWIALISLLGLALSSWVKWRAVATGIIFAVILVPAGVGAIVTGVLHSKWGFLLNVPVMMSLLWERLLGVHSRIENALQLPTRAIVTMLALECCLSMVMLNTRIRAREVVRG
jgi:hypothetical protein